MIHRYRELKVPEDLEGKKELISGYDNQRVIIEDSRKPYSFEGFLHRPVRSQKYYFVTERKHGGERVALKFEDLIGMRVQVPHLSIGSEDVLDERSLASV